MKYNILLFSCLAVFIFSISSCEDFLEKPVSSNITVDSVFISKTRTEQFLWNVYNTCSIYEFYYFWDGTDQKYWHYGAYGSLVDAATDQLNIEATWPRIARDMIPGNWNATNIDIIEFNSSFCYEGIRNANIFIENVDKSPLSTNEINSMKAEAIFLRALMHFDLMQRLGGIPIVDKVLSVATSEDIEKIKIPRSTYEETVDFIVKSCDDAAQYLPNVYQDNRYLGRIVKGAALALKARTLLYAASPLFNSNEPYVPISNAELRAMTGYTSHDPNRWQLAVDANKAVLDWAKNESGWCKLYNEKATPRDSYEEIFVNPAVPEIILDAGTMGTQYPWQWFLRCLLPGYIVGNWDVPVNHAITLNFAKFYQKTDGTEQIWDEQEGVDYPYSQYQSKLTELEPRFQASVFQSGTEYSSGSGIVYHFYESNNLMLSGIQGVGFMRKFTKGVHGSSFSPRWITFRLAEFYLNYAEALNEVNGSPIEITAAVNEVRQRVGLPGVSYTNRDEMREIIRRERAVELAFEQHRYFDVRRWKIAGQEGVMRGTMYKWQLYPGESATPASAYYRLEKINPDRIWDDKMYLYPFRQKEVNLGYITQNPGW